MTRIIPRGSDRQCICIEKWAGGGPGGGTKQCTGAPCTDELHDPRSTDTALWQEDMKDVHAINSSWHMNPLILLLPTPAPAQPPLRLPLRPLFVIHTCTHAPSACFASPSILDAPVMHLLDLRRPIPRPRHIRHILAQVAALLAHLARHRVHARRAKLRVAYRPYCGRGERAVVGFPATRGYGEPGGGGVRC